MPDAIPCTEPELLQRLQKNMAGTVLVTSTVRAARALRQRYDEWQASTGNSAWMTPQIFAWDAWVGHLWDAATLSGMEARTRLTPAQERELWRTVLATDETARQTLSAETLAGLACEAWTQMQRYRIAPEQLRGDASQDTQAFAEWIRKFERACRQRSFLTASGAEAALVLLGRKQPLAVPQTLLLLGFDRMPPAQKLLIDFLASSGCTAETVELRPRGSDENHLAPPAIVCAATVDEEIAAAARWAQERLARNPRQRIGVIVTGLEALQPAVDAWFRRTLAPDSMDVRMLDARLPYEFSLGTPMHRLPAISTALLLLRWLRNALPIKDVSWLLVQGEFGDRAANWQERRARLDARFPEERFRLGAPVALPSFLQWMSHAGEPSGPGSLRRCLEQVSAEAGRQGLQRRRTPAEWRDVMEPLLTAVGWRTLAPATSAEYQLLRRWNAVLDELASLGSVLGAVPFATALEKLDTAAASTLFTLETRHAPIQILGVAESAGLTFDAVWWMNVAAENWPLRGSALPLLPWRVQRDAGMPYASPQMDNAFALRTTRRVLSSASALVASFAVEAGGDAASRRSLPQREALLSPLIREALPDIPIESVESLVPAPLREEGEAEVVLERVEQEPAIPLQQATVRGGVRFLELQAACPFRAFAELRLHAEAPEEPSAGLSPAEQGTLLHGVLDRFWQQIRSSAELHRGTAAEHGELLRQIIRQEMARRVPQSNDAWQQALLGLEADRLEQRLLAWLEKEKERPAFDVMETEENHTVQLGELEFHCRVDRVDKVSKGLVLLDYKSGKVKRSACDGERPDQPQLPAYAVLGRETSGAQEALAGIAFAGLNPREIGFTVIRSQAGVFQAAAGAADEDSGTGQATPKKRWDPCALSAAEMLEQQREWGATLTRLAEQFRAGVAMVDPKKRSETCTRCAQQLLCRIQETTTDLEEEDDGPQAEANGESAGGLST